MKPEEIQLLSARITAECAIAQLSAIGKAQETLDLKDTISMLMEKYGANEDQY